MKRILVLVAALLMVAGGLAGNSFRNSRALQEGASYKFTTKVDPSASGNVASASASTASSSQSPSASSSEDSEADDQDWVEITYQAVIARVDGSTVAQVENQSSGQTWQAHISRVSGSGYVLTAPDMPDFTIKQSGNPFGESELDTTPEEIVAKDQSIESVGGTQVLSASPLLDNGQIDPDITIVGSSDGDGIECTAGAEAQNSFSCLPYSSGADACWLDPSSANNILCAGKEVREFNRYRDVHLERSSTAGEQTPVWLETEDGSQFRILTGGARSMSADGLVPAYTCVAGPCLQNKSGVLVNYETPGPRVDMSPSSWQVQVGTLEYQGSSVVHTVAVTKAWTTSRLF